MINCSQPLTAKKGFSAALFIIAVVLVLLAPNAAVNVDEQLHYPHAKKVVNWYFTLGKDKSCLDTPLTNLKYYSQSVDNATALINRVFNVNNEFLVRHYTGALCFWLLLLFTGLLAHRLTGSWLTALFTILSLALMPRLAGQAFGNLKDIPFAAGYMAGLLMIIRFLEEIPHPRPGTALGLGLAIAFTVSVRAGGLILFAYLGLGLFVYAILKTDSALRILSDRSALLRMAGALAVVTITGYFAGLLFWPYALQDVFRNPLESLRVMEHYKVSIHQLFDGQMMWSTQLPWYYLPKWLLISTPGFVLAGFILFLIYFFRDTILKGRYHKQLLGGGFVLFAFAFPLFYVIAIRSNLYSGVRQMLFILPPMALLAVWGVVRLIRIIRARNKSFSYLVSGIFLIFLLVPLRHQVGTFPVDYVFFNSLSGGNKNSWANYEYDYYFHGLKEASEYFIDLAGKKEITVALNCNLSVYFEQHENLKCQYVRFQERSSYDWDYGLFGVNYLHPYLLKTNGWQPADTVKTFYHKGNPVAILVKRTNKTDFYGISEIKNGSLNKGITLLKKAIEHDPNNVWLYVHLAQAMKASGDRSGFDHFLHKGKIVHPFFEPLLLLEAENLFEEGNYRESLQKVNMLLKINLYYEPAKELLLKLQEKSI